jgi:hypothetical protein
MAAALRQCRAAAWAAWTSKKSIKPTIIKSAETASRRFQVAAWTSKKSTKPTIIKSAETASRRFQVAAWTSSKSRKPTIIKMLKPPTGGLGSGNSNGFQRLSAGGLRAARCFLAVLVA